MHIYATFAVYSHIKARRLVAARLGNHQLPCIIGRVSTMCLAGRKWKWLLKEQWEPDIIASHSKLDLSVSTVVGNGWFVCQPLVAEDRLLVDSWLLRKLVRGNHSIEYQGIQPAHTHRWPFHWSGSLQLTCVSWQTLEIGGMVLLNPWFHVTKLNK